MTRQGQTSREAGTQSHGPIPRERKGSRATERRRSDPGRHPRGRRNSFRLGSQDVGRERHTLLPPSPPRLPVHAARRSGRSRSRRDSSSRRTRHRMQRSERRHIDAESRPSARLDVRTRTASRTMSATAAALNGSQVGVTEGEGDGSDGSQRSKRNGRAGRACGWEIPPQREGGAAPSASWGQSPAVLTGGDAQGPSSWGQARVVRLSASASCGTRRSRWGVLWSD